MPADVIVTGWWLDSDENPAVGTVYFQRHDLIQSLGSSIIFEQVERATLDQFGRIETVIVGADPDDPNPLTRFYRVTERMRHRSQADVYDIEVDATTGTVDLTTVARAEALPEPVVSYASLVALQAEAEARIAADDALAQAIADIEVEPPDLADEATARATADALRLVWRGSWVTATDYVTHDVVRHLSGSFVAIADHTSSGSNTPLASDGWDDWWAPLYMPVPNNVTSPDGSVATIVTITQDAYDALDPPVADRLYIIIEVE